MILFFLCFFAYLLGSVPFGLVFARFFKKQDLRRTGSGNIGATNALRAGGWRLGLATLAGDVLKGAIPAFAAMLLCPDHPPGQEAVWTGLAALSAFFGHLFPVYLKFSAGGKGVATAAGGFSVISPSALAVCLAAFFLGAGISRRVSAGSLAAAGILPGAVFFFTRDGFLSGCALVTALLVIFRHRDNIRRLRSGTEPEIRLKPEG